MITLQSDILAELISGHIEPILLVTLGFPTAVGGTKNITTAPYNVTVSSTTYTADKSLISSSIPSEHTDLSRDLYELQFVDELPATGYRYRFTDAGWTGITLSLSLAFVRTSGALTNNVLNVYAGICSTVTSSASNEGLVTTARFVSQLAQIDGTRMMLLTLANQALRDTTDTSLRYLHTNRLIEWGRTA